jgi:hypothetical protein
MTLRGFGAADGLALERASLRANAEAGSSLRARRAN